MNALLISRRFNPGHLSHLIANAKLLEEAGYRVGMLWHPQFETFGGPAFAGGGTTLARAFRLGSNDAVVIWFPSVQAMWDALLLRLFTRATIVYVLHEPFDSVQAYRRAGFSWPKTARVMLISLISRLTAAFSHHIMLPSESAAKAFRLHHGDGKSAHVIPLLFDDEAHSIPQFQQRRFISYIGTVAEDHAFDQFVDFLLETCAKQTLPDHAFLIATRSTLSAALMERMAPAMQQGLLTVQQGRPLSNEEINDCYQQSAVVWNAYKRSMQSGVLPKAYMFGTPVLITDANRSEFFTDGQEGVEVSSSYDNAELLRAVQRILAAFTHHSAQARATFLKKYHYKALAGDFLRMLRSPT
jgi:glycosyltransferase involved in cell wall biosynthesis